MHLILVKKIDKIETILVTGAAGFIGYSLCLKLLENGKNVIGIDNVNDYYEVSLKEDRLKNINQFVKDKKNLWNFIQ